MRHIEPTEWKVDRPPAASFSRRKDRCPILLTFGRGKETAVDPGLQHKAQSFARLLETPASFCRSNFKPIKKHMPLLHSVEVSKIIAVKQCFFKSGTETKHRDVLQSNRHFQVNIWKAPRLIFQFY